MTAHRKTKQLCIGLAEVRASERSDVLEDMKGAFVNIVTWAASAEEFKYNAELVLSKLHLFVVEIQDFEVVSRRRKKVEFSEEIEDMIERAECNPNAIIYGTFHTYERDAG